MTMTKVRLLVDRETSNPKFDKKKPVTPENHPAKPILKGTVIESPDAWRLCLPEAGTEIIIAEPVDDITKQIVAAKMELRKQRLEKRAAEGNEDAIRQLRDLHSDEEPAESGSNTTSSRRPKKS